MKRSVKIISFILAVITVVMFAASCSTNSVVVAKDDKGNKISLAMYSLMTSLMKGSVAYYVTSKYGNYNSEKFWTTIIDSETQMTYREYYTYLVDEKVKTYLAALTLFSEYDLSLTKEELAAIDKEMEDFVSYDGNGSKNNLNGILREYGANYDTLRDYKIMNAKIAKVSVYLYGENGSKIEDNVKQEYLENNYVAFKQIMIPTYTYVYEKDKYGNDIYYKKNANGEIEKAENAEGKTYPVIAYDTLNGITIDSDKDGKDDVDENGNKIYFVADSENVQIAYDKALGIRVAATDDKGNEVIRKYTDEEKKEIKKNAEAVNALVTAGDYKGFENLITIYDENYSVESGNEPGDMYYLNKNKSYVSIMTDGEMLDKVCAEIEKLEVGGSTMIETDYGYHIMMRYEVENGAYAEKKYTNWFNDTNGAYDFNTDLVNSLFVKKLTPYIEKTVIDEAAKADVDISRITPNYNFY